MFNLLLGTRGRDSFILLNPYILSRDPITRLSLNKFSTRRYCSITFISLFISYFQVKIDVSESSREFRQATFVMYNCARLAKLFENFEKNVLKGENKQNSHRWKTHVKQLRVSIILLIWCVSWVIRERVYVMFNTSAAAVFYHWLTVQFKCIELS